MSERREVDYTTWRKGRRVSRSYFIGVCPKCGRKGAIRPVGRFVDGKVRTMLVTHRAIEREVGGITFEDAVDRCVIREGTE